MIIKEHEDFKEKNQKSALMVLILAVFIDLLGFTIVIPLLPFWTLSLGAPEYVFGIFLAIYSLFQFIFSPIWGRLSDKYGRKPIILSGLTGTLISFSILLIAAVVYNSLEMILLSRIVGGIFTAATLPTSYAYISDSVKLEDQTKSYGLIGASMGLAYVLGPALGGTLTEVGKLLLKNSTGYWVPISLAVLLSAINLGQGLRKLPETLTEELKITIRSKKEKNVSRLEVFKVLRQNPRIMVLILLFSIANYAFSSLDAILAIFGKAIFNMDELLAGLVFMVAGIVMIVTQGFLVGKLAKRFKKPQLIIVGFILMTIGFTSMVFDDSLILMMIIVFPVCFGLSIAQPSANSMISKEMPPEKRGEIMGINESFKSGMRVIGPIIASTLITLDLYLPWYFTGLVLFVGIFLALLLSSSIIAKEDINLIKVDSVTAL